MSHNIRIMTEPELELKRQHREAVAEQVVTEKERRIAVEEAIIALPGAIRELTQAFRSTFDEVRREAYGQGRDDEANNLDYRYEAGSTP